MTMGGGPSISWKIPLNLHLEESGEGAHVFTPPSDAEKFREVLPGFYRNAPERKRPPRI